MKWVIKNPAPSDSRREKWGDFHFGRSLTKYLTRLGHSVVTHYDPGWNEHTDCDVVLLLRGKYPFPPGPEHPGAMRVMWNISHPADVPIEEYATHDIVCVASNPWARELREKLDVPVHALLQCTDAEEFFEVPNAGFRSDVIFVGNTRNVERQGVLWAIEYGLPLRIWGRGWNKTPGGSSVVAEYFPNDELGALYSRSLATLNDHWGDMREFGFINNRIFDALACGLPVVSDWHEELAALDLPGVLLYQDRDGFQECMEELLLDAPRLIAAAASTIAIVHDEFSFEARAQALVDLVTTHKGG